MKKESLLKLFPSLTNRDIAPLPDELAVCWYPSSGNHYTTDQHHNGYQILQHWNEQSTILKPNFFIFSDIEFFYFPPNSEVFSSKVEYESEKEEEDPFLEFLEIPEHPEIIPSSSKSDIKEVYEINPELLKFLDDTWLINAKQTLKGLGSDKESSIKIQLLKQELNIFVSLGLLDPTRLKKNILKEREELLRIKEIDEVTNTAFDIIKRVNLIKYLDYFFLLVQGRNEVVYNRFISESQKIPMLTINRPRDPFIHKISLQELGVIDLILGTSHSIDLDLSGFAKKSNFIFQSGITKEPDNAILYSFLRKK